MNKKTIVIDARLFAVGNGGIGRYSQNLIKELAQLDNQNQYTVLLNKDGMQEWSIEASNFKPLEVNIPIFSFSEQIKLKFLLDRLKPDLVHFLNFNHPVLYRGAYIATIHDLTMNFFPSGRKSKSFIRRAAYNWVMNNAAKYSQFIIVPSNASKEDLIMHLKISKQKILVTYEAADDAISRANKTNNRPGILDKYKVKRPFLLFVSQWRPHKGIPELIEAYKIIFHNHKDYQLVLTGKGRQDFQEIINQVEEAKKVTNIVTTGFLKDYELSALYQEADYLIFPSHYEGFGLPMLEAAQQGCPTITTDSSCMREIMGDAALYYKTGDSADLAKTIESVLTKKEFRSKLSLKASSRASLFSWQKTASQTLDLYKKIFNLTNIKE